MKLISRSTVSIGVLSSPDFSTFKCYQYLEVPNYDRADQRWDFLSVKIDSFVCGIVPHLSHSCEMTGHLCV